MNKFINGLTVSSAGLAMGGLATVLAPNQVGAVAIAGAMGSSGAAMAMQQRKDRALQVQRQELMSEFQQAVYRIAQPMEHRMEGLKQRMGALEEATARAQAMAVQAAETVVAMREEGVIGTSNRLVAGDREQVIAVEQAEETAVVSLPSYAPTAALAADTIAWLGTRDIQVATFRDGCTDRDLIFDRMALMLGGQFEVLGVLFRQLKRSAVQGGYATLNMKGRSQAERGAMTNFCTQLYRYGMLSEYKYSRSKQSLKLVVQPRSDIQRFFVGDWFERYVYQVVVKLLRQRQVAYSALMNPQVILPNGDRFEFDLLFLVEGQPLWLECKTGKDINLHLMKYGKHRQTMDIPKGRSFLVMLDYSTAQSQGLEHLWEMTAASERSVEELVGMAVEGS